MKRNILIAVTGVACLALFALLVHAVLVVGNVSDASTATVRGATARRAWATSIAVVGLIGVAAGALALGRPTDRFGRVNGPLSVTALVAGAVALTNGIANIGTADGGPGSGNGVVGAAAACVLGAIALALGAVALRLRHHTAARADGP